MIFGDFTDLLIVQDFLKMLCFIINSFIDAWLICGLSVMVY